MAEVTVAELAKSVNVSVEHLLAQMKEAGLSHQKAEQFVSDEDKQTLLAHLRSSHGEDADASKRITLKRRTITKLKTGSAGKRTVNVEIRKKRTYVKREDGLETTQELDGESEEFEQQEGIEEQEQHVAAEQPVVVEELPAEPEPLAAKPLSMATPSPGARGTTTAPSAPSPTNSRRSAPRARPWRWS